jgi:hypothetical protein
MEPRDYPANPSKILFVARRGTLLMVTIAPQGRFWHGSQASGRC